MPGAQQRRRVLGREVVRDAGQRLLRDHDGLGVAAVVGDAGDAQRDAVDEVPAPARVAAPADPAEPADPDALAGRPALDAVAHHVDHARDLVPGDAGVGDAGPVPLLGQRVAVADAARLHGHADLPAPGLGRLALDELEVCSCAGDLDGADGGHGLRCSSGVGGLAG